MMAKITKGSRPAYLCIKLFEVVQNIVVHSYLTVTYP